MTNDEYNILVVDDMPESLDVTSSFLMLANYTVHTACDGIEAILLLEQKKMDLVILDVSMPDMDGFEVSRRIKNNKRTKEIPIIFLSARSNSDDKIEGFDSGGVDYLEKPVNSQELLRRVNVQLNAKARIDTMQKENKELKEYNHRIRELAEKLKLKNKDLISSINYAKFIQRAVLATEHEISEYLPENFILFLPRDIVSGDFYWVRQIDEQILIAVVDCTGHGVPGSLLSMLGITYLNEIVSNYPKSKKIMANEVLNFLRERVKETLSHDIEHIPTREGMDVALCILDVNTKEMQYAGANRPIYIIRKTEKEPTLIHFKPDLMPVGSYIKERSFNIHDIELLPGDQVVMFTDGYPDQLGGQDGQKFFTKNMMDLFVEISDMPLKEQKEVLLENFETWKGYFNQIDDVLILSFKISELYGEDIEFF